MLRHWVLCRQHPAPHRKQQPACHPPFHLRVVLLPLLVILKLHWRGLSVPLHGSEGQGTLPTTWKFTGAVAAGGISVNAGFTGCLGVGGAETCAGAFGARELAFPGIPPAPVLFAGGCGGVLFAGGCSGVLFAGGCGGVLFAGGCGGVLFAGGGGVVVAGAGGGVVFAGAGDGVVSTGAFASFSACSSAISV